MESYNNRLSAALLQPIVQTRCAELTVLFARCSIHDLQSFFPLLIEQIFGTRYSKTSWGLQNIMSTSCDFQIIQHFFSPTGPLFQLIYTLLRDSTLKYEFHLNEVPNIQLSEFYADMIYCRSPTTNKPTVLILNPFNYYIFSFAQHLLDIRYSFQETGAQNLKLNSLYYILCCDYVLHFLPTNLNSVVLPIVAYDGSFQSMRTYAVVQRPMHNSHLFKQSACAEVVHELSGAHQYSNQKRDIWRSETVLHVFIDMWLYIPNVGQSDFTMNSVYAELPCSEQIRIVRVLVKQVHAFASTAAQDQSNMAELKKIARTLLLAKMYRFLRCMIYRWPLDGSFRLLLELWLSYVQPWRYTVMSQNNLLRLNGVNQDAEDNNNKLCDDEYVPFLAENLLQYVVIFQQLLPRFLRVDLSSPKNSLMLYRLTKVFNQDNLVRYLKEIESCVENRNNSPTHFISHCTNDLPPLSPTSCWCTNNTSTMDNTQNSSYYDTSMNAYSLRSETNPIGTGRGLRDKYAGLTRQKIYELEGMNFCYKPLFIGMPAKEVHDLLRYVKASERTAIEILQARQTYINQHYSGFFGFMRSLFSVTDPCTDDCTLDERKKVPLFLQCSFEYLTDMFQIQDFHFDPDSSQREGNLSSQNVMIGGICNSADDSAIETLTPEKVKQRTMLITYEGDPDLYPVRSNENTFLVRMLYQLALLVNKTYGQQIESLYQRPNYIGKLVRRFICAPTNIVTYEKPLNGRRRRVVSNLPPRISFRKFANHNFIIFTVVAYLLLKLLGCTSWVYILFYFTIWCGYHLIAAVFDKVQAI